MVVWNSSPRGVESCCKLGMMEKQQLSTPKCWMSDFLELGTSETHLPPLLHWITQNPNLPCRQSSWARGDCAGMCPPHLYPALCPPLPPKPSLVLGLKAELWWKGCCAYAEGRWIHPKGTSKLIQGKSCPWQILGDGEMGALPRLGVRRKLPPGCWSWIFMLYPYKGHIFGSPGKEGAQGMFGPLTPKLLWKEEMLPQGFH